MTKSEARDALRMEVHQQTGQNLGGRVLKDSSTTFGWFARNRYFPLREGDWRLETASVKKIQIEQDLLAKFEEYPLDSIDRFMLQTHINNLAERLSQDRVKQARSYLMSIFGEIIDQDFLVKDPTRKLKTPRNLRPKDKEGLCAGAPSMTWIHCRSPKPSTRERLTVRKDRGEPHRWKQESAKASKKGFVCPDAFIFPNSRGGFLDTGNYRNRVLTPLAEKLEFPKLNFQIMRRTMATQAQSMGSVKDIQAHLRHAKADTTANEYMQELPESVKRMVASV
jgi:integrase